MPKKLTRLKKRTDFLRISAKKCSKVMDGFIIQVDNNPHIDNSDNLNALYPRVGFTVSKKVGNAVKRNLVKRRLRSLADNLIKAEDFGGIDCVIIGRKPAIDIPFSKLAKDFYDALQVVLKKVKSNS